jgi:hypothetical protein
MSTENIFAAGAQGFADATNLSRSFRTERARARAAPRIAAGDYSGAAQQYGQAGMADEARDAVRDQQVMDQVQYQHGRQTKEDGIADAQRRVETLQRLATGLTEIPEGANGEGLVQRKAALDHAMPIIQQIDPDPNGENSLTKMLGALPPEHLSNASLHLFTGKLQQEWEGVNLGNGAFGRFSKSAGTFEQLRQSDAKYMNVPPENTLLAVGGEQPPPAAARAAPGASPAAPAAQGDPAAFAAPLTALGAKVTSGVRTPAHNAEVGGVPNSQHITGNAVDLVPPPGMTLAQLGDEARRRVPGAKVIVENDHVHIQHGGAAQAGPAGPAGARVLYQAPPKAEQEDAPLTPEAVEMQAAMYLSTRQLPSMGMGKTGTRNRTLILNKATELAKSLGLDANDLVAGSMSVKAAGQALGKATSIRSQVEGSERTVLQNAQYALSLAPRGGGPTRAPVLNRWIQAGRKNIAGDPDVAAFDQSIHTVAEEYAKVMTTTTGTGGATSDSARQEAYRRLNGAMNPAQLKSVIESMRVEMDNRAASLREVENGLRSSIRAGSGDNRPGQAAPDPAADPIAQARDAISRGADRAAVIKRLREHGINPSGL